MAKEVVGARGRLKGAAGRVGSAPEAGGKRGEGQPQPRTVDRDERGVERRGAVGGAAKAIGEGEENGEEDEEGRRPRRGRVRLSGQVVP